MHWDGGWPMGFMWFWWILVIAGIAAIVWFVINTTQRRGDKGDEESPEEILKRRFAKGEIDQETYERMLQDLRK